MTTPSQKMLDRMAKLLAMSKDTSSPNEAEIAKGQLFKLMAKFNLSQDDISDNHADDMGISIVTFESRPWIRTIVTSISSLYFCNVIFIRNREKRSKSDYMIIGRAINREYAVSLIENAHRTLLSDKYQAQKNLSREDRRGFGTSFLRMASATIHNECVHLKRGAVQSGDMPGLGDKYLEVVDANEAWIADNFDNVTPIKSKPSNPTNLNGARLGQKAGESVQLNTGLESAQTKESGNLKLTN